jgi:hypothetical protein
MQIVPRAQTTKVQKMIKKYAKLLSNLVIKELYTLFSIKNKKFFLFLKNLGTIGTNEKR